MELINTNTTLGLPSTPDAPPAIPNQLTPMAFLPPDVAVSVTVSTYVLIGTLSVQIWDTLAHIVDDYHLVRRNRVHTAMLVYFISRVGALAYLLTFTILSSAPVGNCELFHKCVAPLYIFTLSTSELLLLLHVRAVYIHNRPVVLFFVALWIMTLASSTTPLISAYTGHHFLNLGTTPYCVGTILAPYITATATIPLINDILLFIALAWRLQRSSYAGPEGKQQQFKNMFLGRHLPRVSRALFQNGQAYFLITVVTNFVTLVLVLDSSAPTAYRAIMGYPSIVLMNVMSSRIYRNVNSGVFNVEDQTSILSHPGVIVQVQRVEESSQDDLRTKEYPSGDTKILDLTARGDIESIKVLGEE